MNAGVWSLMVLSAFLGGLYSVVAVALFARRVVTRRTRRGA